MDISNDKTRANLIQGGINFIFGKSEEMQNSFRKEALLLKKARSLCQSLLERDERMKSAYFEAIRVALNHISRDKQLSLKEINEQINTMLEQSVRSSGVINLFSDKDKEFSLFDTAFLEEISRMKEKNLAAELLRKLTSEQIILYKRTNIVQSEKFSERMQEIMNHYRNCQLSNAEVIEELRKMADDIKKDHEKGNEFGFNSEERAFYDAITKPEAVKDFYSNEQLCEMTKELTEELRKSRTIDWQKKESARAGMRRMVKRLLKKYKYPPESMEDAVSILLLLEYSVLFALTCCGLRKILNLYRGFIKSARSVGKIFFDTVLLTLL